MSNPNCEVVLSVGPNKGRKCGEVGGRCRHGTFICEWCQKSFGYGGSLARHLLICMKYLNRKVDTVEARSPALSAISRSADELIRKHPAYESLVRPNGCLNLDAIDYLQRNQEAINITIVNNYITQYVQPSDNHLPDAAVPIKNKTMTKKQDTHPADAKQEHKLLNVRTKPLTTVQKDKSKRLTPEQTKKLEHGWRP